jgi:hypothetical protein
MKLLRTPMVRWDARYKRMSENDRWETSEQAVLVAVRAARLCAYLSRRRSGGTHADAVKAQNEAARKVRQALGDTYANDAITF